MNIIEALKKRQSIRAFKPDNIDREIILKILEAATYAPSWANSQPWEIFVADGKVLQTIKKKFAKNFQEGVKRAPEIPVPQSWPTQHQKRIDDVRNQRLIAIGAEPGGEDNTAKLFESNYRFFGAPVVVYICMDSNLTTWSVYDIGSLAQNIMLAAQEYGIDSIPAYNLVSYPAIIRNEFNLPDEYKIIIGIALGYRDNANPINKFRSQRRNINEVVRFKDE